MGSHLIFGGGGGSVRGGVYQFFFQTPLGPIFVIVGPNNGVPLNFWWEGDIRGGGGGVLFFQSPLTDIFVIGKYVDFACFVPLLFVFCFDVDL